MTRASDFPFNGVVRLTRIGTTYVLFTIVIGFAALNTGNNALYIALQEFVDLNRGANQVRRSAIVVLTDGEDTASLLSYDDVLDRVKRDIAEGRTKPLDEILDNP